MTGDYSTFNTVLKHNEIKNFKHFVNYFMIQAVSRVTLEIFTEPINETDRNFMLPALLLSNEKAYKLTTFEDLLKESHKL